jgi:hypothetical protein
MVGNDPEMCRVSYFMTSETDITSFSKMLAGG